MDSKITGGELEYFDTARMLNRYDVNYYRCVDTGFIQTDDPFWLSEAYSSPVCPADVGYVSRNISLSTVISSIIDKNFSHVRRSLDFGAGVGLFVRIMRDKGHDFRWLDPFSENLFAQGFEASRDKAHGFDLLTAFEVFEHLPDPMTSIAEMVSLAPIIIFSTAILPRDLKSVNEWSYFIPEVGQHVSFYTIESLHFVADKFDCYLYTDGASLHCFSSTPLEIDPFLPDKASGAPSIPSPKVINRKYRKSLQDDDLEYVFKTFYCS